MSALVRLLSEEDIPFAMRLKDAAGWNQTERDWRSLLAFRPDGCFAALWEGRATGTVTTLDYDGAIGWIGMLLVSAEHRGRGIGSELLRAALASLAGVATVKLDATPLGQDLYERHGFEGESVIERRVRRAPGASSPPAAPGSAAGLATRPLEPAGLAAAADLDAEAFGARRLQVLAAWQAALPGRAFAAERGGRLRGFVLARPGTRGDHLGPLIAADPEAARGLIQSAIAASSGRDLILDAPAADGSWLHHLEGLGFVRERSLTRMRRGPPRLARDPGLLRATAGPEVG